MRVVLTPTILLFVLAVVAVLAGCGVRSGDSSSDVAKRGDDPVARPLVLSPVLRDHVRAGTLEAGLSAHDLVELLGNPAREYQVHARDHDERWIYLTLQGPVNFYLRESQLVRWDAGVLPVNFRPSPHPEFWLPRRQHVQALVFDGRGACVDTLLDEVMPVGTISLAWAGRPQREGIRQAELYECRITTEDTTFTRKLALRP